MKKRFLCLLAICLLLTCTACARDRNGEQETDAPITASPKEIASQGRIAEDALPEDTAVRDWYDDAVARSIVRNTVLFSRGEDGTWGCWLYLGDWTEGDGLTFGADTSDGYRVVISHAAQRTDGEEGAGGVFYFTVQTDAEPEFDLFVNREPEGMIVTHSESVLAKP